MQAFLWFKSTHRTARTRRTLTCLFSCFFFFSHVTTPSVFLKTMKNNELDALVMCSWILVSETELWWSLMSSKWLLILQVWAVEPRVSGERLLKSILLYVSPTHIRLHLSIAFWHRVYSAATSYNFTRAGPASFEHWLSVSLSVSEAA